ncbi:hypothetical protein [Thalassobacillus sp. CUG 92003]|uniref:hypothetical protein n=1 Tax=Thalassobacillus sp. CUG 92003 TaxID=2736641 RepID=UPI0015E76D44|nr:hypothetical protein [Thalassobacillus sp. CUG 92003]
MLFHYHYWTPYVEETEKFYHDIGFTVSQRIGKLDGEYQAFNPPLQWENFRESAITFRIIEMKKGAVNVTFGLGKRPMFDHIGFLTTEEDHDRICGNAEALKWKVNRGERRTFIATPYQFRIELQTHGDVIESRRGEEASIQHMAIAALRDGLEADLQFLFGQQALGITSVRNQGVRIQSIRGVVTAKKVDPNGVVLLDE